MVVIIAFTTVKRAGYSHIIHDIGISDAVDWLKNYVLDDRGYI